MGFENVGKAWSPEELIDELAQTPNKPSWCNKIALHHTASPTLAIRPRGFSIQHIKNIRDYYANTRGWNSGPHFFVDEHRILGMSSFFRPGIHSVGFNATALGIEVLGDYDHEEPLSGRGLGCWFMAAQLAAILANWLNLEVNENTIVFHRDDQFTQKTCPGNKIEKAWVLELINQAENSLWAEALVPTKPDLGIEWSYWDLQNETWHIPLYAFLRACDIKHELIITSLRYDNGAFYLGADLLEGAHYVGADKPLQPNGCTWLPAHEALFALEQLRQSISRAPEPPLDTPINPEANPLVARTMSLSIGRGRLLEAAPALEIAEQETINVNLIHGSLESLNTFSILGVGDQQFAALARSATPNNMIQGNGQNRTISLNDLVINDNDVTLLLSGNFNKLVLQDLFLDNGTITIAPANNRYVSIKQLVLLDCSGVQINGNDRIVVSSSANNITETYQALVEVKSYDCTITGLIVNSVSNSQGWSPYDWGHKAKTGIRILGEGCIIENNKVTNVHIGIEACAPYTIVRDNIVKSFCNDGIRPLADNCEVIGNTIAFAKDSQQGLHCDGIQMFSYTARDKKKGTLTGIVIEDNYIWNTIPSYPDDKTFYMQGIVCFDGLLVDCVISNNYVLIDHEHGIAIINAKECTIENNIILSTQANLVKNWLKVGAAHANFRSVCQGNKVNGNYALTFDCNESMLTDYNDNVQLDINEIPNLLSQYQRNI